MSTLSDLLRISKEDHEKQAGVLERTHREIVAAYLAAHEEIADTILTVLPENLTTFQLEQTIRRVSKSANLLKFITDRTHLLNKKVADVLAVETDRAVRFSKAAASREGVVLGGSGLRGWDPDSRQIEQGLATAVANIEGWNHKLHADILRNLRVGAINGEPYSQVESRVRQSTTTPALTPGIARARAHALNNTRYCLVHASNSARIGGYKEIETRSELKIKKAWFAAIGTCCTSCAMLHGRVVDLDRDFPFLRYDLPIKPFDGVLLHPPLHPNCRCRVIPVTADVLPLILRASSAREARLLSVPA